MNFELWWQVESTRVLIAIIFWVAVGCLYGVYRLIKRVKRA